jgi:hypothetical protein
MVERNEDAASEAGRRCFKLLGGEGVAGRHREGRAFAAAVGLWCVRVHSSSSSSSSSRAPRSTSQSLSHFTVTGTREGGMRQGQVWIAEPNSSYK